MLLDDKITKNAYEKLLIVERLAKEEGLTEMRLGVMNHNAKAIKLYTRAGYTVFKEREHDCIMQKFLL